MLYLAMLSPGVTQTTSSCWVKHFVAPGYPRLAWFAQLQGTVQVDVEVGPEGKVLSAVATGAHNLLERAAEENIRDWLFASGDSISRLKMTFIYKLEGQREHEPSPPKVIFDLPDKVTIVARPPEPEP